MSCFFLPESLKGGNNLAEGCLDSYLLMTPPPKTVQHISTQDKSYDKITLL